MTVEMEIEKKAKQSRQFFILGPPTMLISFAQALTLIVFTDMLIYYSCFTIVNNKINGTIESCSLLHKNTSSNESVKLEAETEPYASMVLMTKSLIESILPAMISLFLGPWSDRGGRRPLLLAGFSGFTVMYTMLFIMSNWQMSPWYMLIPSVPAFILGGPCTISLASVCFITDIAKEKDRTVLFTWLQASTFSGLLLGIFTGPIVYEYCGYNGVFSTAAICCATGLIYIYFLVPESVKNVSKGSVFGMFKLSLLMALLKCTTVKRNGFRRSIFWLAVFLFTSAGMVYSGELSIAFLFSRARLSWDVEQHSYLSGTGIVLMIVGLCGVSLLSPMLGMTDTSLVGIGLLSGVISSIARAYVTQGWHLYFANFTGMLTGIVGPVMRSIISKSVPVQDVGKVFSLTALLETLSPLGGAPLFILVYSNYLPPIYPLPVYLLSAGYHIFLLIVLIIIELLSRKFRKTDYVTTAQEDY